MLFSTIYRPTGRTYYCRYIRQVDNYIWDDVREEMLEATSWMSSTVAIVEVSGTGQYPIPIPDSLPAGVIYDVVVYRRAGAIDVNTDIVDSGYILKRGGSFGF